MKGTAAPSDDGDCWDGRITDEDMIDVPDHDPNDWIIADIVPRRDPWLFAGKYKHGKTTAARSLIVSMVLGIDWCGFENKLGRPAKVMFFALEERRRQTVRSLQQLLRPHGLTMADSRVRENLRIFDRDKSLKLARDAKALGRAARDWGADLILIDSVSRVADGDQNSSADATAFTSAWGELMALSGSSVGFLHHMNKGFEAGLPEVDSVRGSGEWIAYPRHLVLLKRVPQKKAAAIVLCGNMDLQRETPWVLEYRPMTDTTGRMCVEYADCGEYETYRGGAAAERKQARLEKREAEQETKDRTALRVLAENSGCSAATLASKLKVGDETARKLVGRWCASGWADRGAQGRGACITDRGRAFAGLPTC